MNDFEVKRKVYEDVVFQINREDRLANHRMVWTLQVNGFIFAALMFLARENPTEIKVFYIFILPMVGMCVSIAGFFGVLAAYMQIINLTKIWKERVDKYWIMPFGEPFGKYSAIVSGVFFHFILVIAWSIWLIINFRMNFNLLNECKNIICGG